MKTFNIMGFLGVNDSRLVIASRFANQDGKDYFLHYMLQKVLSINILDFDQNTNQENIWNFLIYMFSYYLRKAYSQGMFKVYQYNRYNEAKMKGSLDMKRHLIKNIPFNGKIAYNLWEYSYDNNLTQLIRHTIEYIKSHPLGSHIFKNKEINSIVNQFIYVTQKSYNRNIRNKIILANRKINVHPYFTEYAQLQSICIKILKQEKITYGNRKDKVYGLLFDGAWLWEEYLNTVLKDNFIHPENKTGKNKYYLFENKVQSIYPDFVSHFDPVIVGDAKYIPLEKHQSYYENSERAINIYYKTISYMYRFNSLKGFLAFPNKDEHFFEEYRIEKTKGVLRKIGLAIPQKINNFNESL
ncbi:McrC family protein [Riemerella columbina]|uniref:McrC family protein n=1 Tax=Riemerella columbina TaxID=103810 RepID=UPI00266EFF03|nr:restriction endonuclease [Riemerella columbina]WKS95888.1 restriction endonuclease [Riemerella columbina]